MTPVQRRKKRETRVALIISLALTLGWIGATTGAPITFTVAYIWVTWELVAKPMARVILADDD